MFGLMNKILLISFLMLIIMPQVIAVESVVRNLPLSVNGNSAFVVSYTIKGGGDYVMAVEDSISGGCSPTKYKKLVFGNGGKDTILQATFTA